MPSECKLLSLPTRLGCLSILDPSTSASRFYQTSRFYHASMHTTSILSTAIREFHLGSGLACEYCVDSYKLGCITLKCLYDK